MKISHITILAAAFAFASCNSNEPAEAENHNEMEQQEGSNEEGHDEHDHDSHDHDGVSDENNKSSSTEDMTASWQGTYQSMASCPGCDGVIKEISLNEGMTYIQVTKHHGEHIGDVAESGRFTWADEKEQVLIISAGTDSEMQYDVEGEELIGLNKEGERREAEGYGLYTLKKLKKDEPIFGRKWILKAIDGQEIKSSEDYTDAIIFLSEDGSLSGNASCNNFNGTYKVAEDGTIKFGPMATTKKMCGDMRVEDRFLAGMGQVNKYVVHGAKMSLHIGDAAATLKFELAK